jgi:hypothetical protein
MYQVPDPAKFGFGPFPLFIWMPGTGEPYRDVLAFTFVNQMARRGFVAASVDYHNTYAFQRCSEYTARAAGIYERRPTSAVGVLCGLPGVSCGKGIVTAGISQGGALAILAKNYAPDVSAVYAISISLTLAGAIDLSSCLRDENTAIPSNRLTIINGEGDALFSGQDPLMDVSGIRCPPGTFQCWSEDGSGAGWYVVQDSQVEDGNADHCYVVLGDCVTFLRLDRNWSWGTYNWSLKPSLDWLATFGTSRVFSPTGQ